LEEEVFEFETAEIGKFEDPPTLKSISLPIYALTPYFFAVRWKRADPYTPFASASAIPHMPRSAQTVAISSGCAAPSRKLKAERA
jgi:hypothetical protein